MRQFLIISSVLAFAACSPDAGSGTPDTTAPANTATVPAKTASSTAERDAWQKPQEVFYLMGNELRGRTVADLAANDGYFTFKLIEVGANVIAIDDDPAALAAIEARKKEMGLSDERLRTRLSPVGDPGLAPEEVDACLLVCDFVRIPNRRDFLTKVFQGTREPKPLFILEWLPGEMAMGPPAVERISSERVMDELGPAGYTDMGAYSAKIPYQAFIFASHQVETEESLDDVPADQIMEVPSH